MAGSEQDGIDAARADLFVGASVGADADRGDRRRRRTRRCARCCASMHAEVVSVTPDDHDVLVAFVSHVPQLAASTLMDVATAHEERAPRAAPARGGRFPRHDADRREPSGDLARHPRVEPRRGARARSTRTSRRSHARARPRRVGRSRRARRELLGRARGARRNLPVGAAVATDLVELRVPVPDRPGVIAEVTTLAGRLGVNVADFEIAHSLEGGAGVLVLVVAAVERRRVRGRAARARLPAPRARSCREPARPRSSSAARGRCAGGSALPGDKSISHRALIFAALADGAQRRSRTSRPAPTCARRGARSSSSA